jgi:PAS domain-containing protein
MPLENNKKDYIFLNGGGEMGKLIQNFNWDSTSLDTPENWPQNLRTIISMLLNSLFPMFLFWGDEYIQFYNDACLTSFGNTGKHPAALGQRAEVCLAEIWAEMEPILNHVKSGGGSILLEDKMLSFPRHEKMEDNYWTFNCSPILNEDGTVAGVLTVYTETTQKVNKRKAAEYEDWLSLSIEAAELGTWDLNPTTGKFVGNSRLKEWFGLPADAEIPLTAAMDVITLYDRGRVSRAIRIALSHASGGNYDIEYTITNPLTLVVRNVRAKGKARFDENNMPYRFNGILQDITGQKTAKHLLEESELLSHNLIEQYPFRIILLTGDDMIITRANKAMLTSWHKDTSAIGKPLLQAIPEITGQEFPKLVLQVFTTGVPYTALGVPISPYNNNIEDIRYNDFSYQPMYDTTGEIYGVLATSLDVTESIRTLNKLEGSE